MTYLFSSNVEVNNDYGSPLRSSIINFDGNVVNLSNPFPVTLGSNSISIIGNITVPTTVNVASSSDNPVHVHITEVGLTNLLNANLAYMPVGGNVAVTGAVYVNNWPTTSNIRGEVNVNNFPSSFSISGNVEIANDSGNPIAISANNSPNSSTNPIYVSGNTNATIVGNLRIGSMPDSAISAFEEIVAIPITPMIQSDANYGLDPDVWRQTKLLGGNISVADSGLWSITCNTAVNSYARLFTSRYAKYQPGQGMVARWTAAYTITAGNTITTANGVSNCVQVSGPIDREDGYAIGFSGRTGLDSNGSDQTKIGIQHRRAGKVEIRQFTVTTYNTGTQTVIITLNGAPYTITLPASTNTNQAAVRIANLLLATDAGQYWSIDACTSVITFTYYSPGLKNGTYSMSTSGTGTPLAGTFTQLVAGVTQIDTWYYQDRWDNRNVTIDPSKLNVYAMDMRWLGAGAVRFFVEEPSNGKMTLIHTLRWTANQTGLYPHINRPNLRLAYRIGSITGLAPAQSATLSGASIMLGTQGIYNQTSMSQGWYNVDSSGRAKDTVWHLLTIQNPYVRGSSLNKSQLVMQDLTVSAQGNDPMVIFIVKNSVATNDPLEFTLVPSHGSSSYFAQYSVTATFTTLSGENINNIQTLGINGSSQFDLQKYNVTLAPGDTFSVFITSTNAITRTSVGATWRVD